MSFKNDWYQFWNIRKTPFGTNNRFTHDFGDFVNKMMAVVCVHVVIAVFIGVVFHAAFDAFRTQSAKSGWFWFKVQWTNVAKMRNVIVNQCSILSDSISKFKEHVSIIDPSMGRVEGESAWCMSLHDGVLPMKAIPHTHQLGGTEVVGNGSSFKHKIKSL